MSGILRRSIGRGLVLAVVMSLPAIASVANVRPEPRPVADPIPVTRWDFRAESDAWSRAALSALKTHGEPLVEHTPRDIARWCPGYARASETDRRAFWIGFPVSYTHLRAHET